MDVLVTGADGELGRSVAQGFRAAGHRVVVSGARRAEVELVAKELDADAVVCDNADPADLAAARNLFPQQLDAVVIVPGPDRDGSRGSDGIAAEWRCCFDRTVLAAVLTVHEVGEHLRSGGSIVACDDSTGDSTGDRAPRAAAKAALAAWVSSQAAHFGTRGITINAVACGRGAEPGYPGLTTAPLPAATELSRLTVFLTTPAARRITGQLLHAGRGAGAVFG